MLSHLFFAALSSPDFLVLFGDVYFSFVTFPFGILGQVDHLSFLCLVFLMLSRLFIAALWPPAGKGMTS